MIKTAKIGDLDELSRQMDRTMDRMVRTHFSSFRVTDAWSPAVNAYRFSHRIEVCVDLAGVERADVNVRIEGGDLVIRGCRQAPQPQHVADERAQILAMEIDHGPFERRFALPKQVDVQNVTAIQQSGLLWIKLPLVAK